MSSTRIALYSHDAQGLGHVRRNLAIASALAAGGRRDVLLISGAKEAGVFPTPPGVELLTLPAVGKSLEGVYRPRSFALSLERLLRIRTETMFAALECFEPEVLIVDKHPLGLRGELGAAMEHLCERGDTRLVLGLREVLDEPAVVRRAWEDEGALDVMRSCYDAIWIYGDPRVYDPVAAYGLPDDLAAKVRYTGYLGRAGGAPGGKDSPAARVAAGGHPLALCLVGGGEDGFALAAAFADAPLPAGVKGVVVTGPFMPLARRQRLMEQAARRDDLTISEFLDDPAPLIALADSVVAMGGYNTVCELLWLNRRTLIVPRVHPRREQAIRAQRLARLGLVDVLLPDALGPKAVGEWLAAPRRPRPHARDIVDLEGIARLPWLLREIDAMPDRDPGERAAVVA